uniref:Ig-like domain-containing protein n=1 Tax=Schistocephalus solidus TaxID=70667 RepID=A0A0X3PU99_SCHSO
MASHSIILLVLHSLVSIKGHSCMKLCEWPSFVFFIVLVVILPYPVACRRPAPWQEREIFKLQGPRNTSVRRNGTLVLACRLLVAQSNAYRESIFQPWHAAPRYKISVQWNIDGFGYTNDTLTDSFGGRYSMPGPFSQGVFNLEIRNAQVRDQASFTCQVTVHTFHPSQPTWIKTITSEEARVFIFTPPDSLQLWRLPTSAEEETRPTTAVTGIAIERYSYQHHLLDGNRLQADNPSLSDAVPATLNLAANTSASRALAEDSLHSGVLAPIGEGGRQSLLNGEELWAAEGEGMIFECTSSVSNPASVLTWLLSELKHFDPLADSPIVNLPEVGQRQLRPGRTSTVNRRHHAYPSWRFTFEERDAQRYGFQLRNHEFSVDKDMRRTTSKLYLTAERSLSGRRLECVVKNTDVFIQTILPKATVILQIIYITNLRITNNVSPKPEFHEDQIVNFHCSANSNPQDLEYIWTITNPIDKNSPLEDVYFSGVGDLPINTNFKSFEKESGELTPLLLQTDERELSATGHRSSRIELKMTRSLHGRTVRCWVGAKMHRVKSASSGIANNLPTSRLPVWKHISLTLYIRYGPVLQGAAHEIKAVSMGESIQLICIVDANPTATVTWYRYTGIRLVNQHTFNQLSSNASGYGIFSPLILTASFLQSFWSVGLSNTDFQNLGTSRGLNTKTITIKSPDDFSLYICEGEAENQKVVRKITIVGESGPPKIQSKSKVFGRVGQQKQIACKVISLPRPKPHQFVWTSNGQSVLPDESIRIEQEDSLTGATSFIRFVYLKEAHFGSYNCTVTTELGSDFRTIQLIRADEIPYAFAIGVGVTSLVAITFAVTMFLVLRKSTLRSSKRSRIITIASDNQRHTGSILSSPSLHCTPGVVGDIPMQPGNKCMYDRQPPLSPSTYRTPRSPCPHVYNHRGSLASTLPSCASIPGKDYHGSGEMLQVIGPFNVLGDPITPGNHLHMPSSLASCCELRPIQASDIPITALPATSSQLSEMRALYFGPKTSERSHSVASVETPAVAALLYPKLSHLEVTPCESPFCQIQRPPGQANVYTSNAHVQTVKSNSFETRQP